MTINKWSKPIGTLVDRQVKRLEGEARLFAFNLFSAIMRRTPVDSGRFVSNWNVTAGRPDYRYSNKSDVGRALEQLDRVFVLPIARGLYIGNGLPYGRLLEYEGWSRQAPQGMIRVSIAEANMHLAAAKRKERT